MSMDARQLAAGVLQQLNLTELNDEYFCYGNSERVHIGIERKSTFKALYPLTFDELWIQINRFFSENHDEYIMGFIGFDPADQLNDRALDLDKKIDLFIPAQVIECTRTSINVLKGNLERFDGVEYQKDCLNNAVDIQSFDQANSKTLYRQYVAGLLDLIRLGEVERGTLVRKINADFRFDLTKTFLSDHSQHDISKSFMFSSRAIAFAGQSPELLAEGNVECFYTHKLSGTYACQPSEKINRVQQFVQDQRIVAEHESAIKSVEESLSDIGQVDLVKFKVMALPTLLHGWSEFKTYPAKGITIADCLRAIFPFGVFPVQPAFKYIAEHESFSRGPYYGLAGLIEPDGKFSFTQVLRSVFVDHDSSYVMVGAAVTERSTPEIELLETCSKLNGIKVFEKKPLSPCGEESVKESGLIV